MITLNTYMKSVKFTSVLYNKWAFPVLLIIIMMEYSCTKKQNFGPIETISIDPRKMKPEVDITYAIDTGYFEIIPLETNNDCLIAEVTRIYLLNNKIVVYDAMAHGAYIFNRDGSYHAKVCAVGQGPGQYPASINDIMVSNNYIGVLVPPFGIMFYDFDGNFVKKISLEGSWGINLFTFDDIDYYLVNDWSRTDIGCYFFFKLNSEKNRVYSYLPFSEQDGKNGRGWGLDKYYNLYDNSALIYFSSIDTLFHVTPSGEIIPRYAIDIAYNKMPDELKRGNGYEALKSAAANNYYTGIANVAETSRYLFLKINGINYAVYDKKEKEIKTIAIVHKIPSFCNVGIADIFSSTEGDYILTYGSGFDLFNYKKNITKMQADKSRKNGDGINAFEKEFFKVLQNIKNEEDNPVVFIFKAKD